MNERMRTTHLLKVRQAELDRQERLAEKILFTIIPVVVVGAMLGALLLP